MAKESKRASRKREQQIEDMGWDPRQINNEETLTLVSAVCQILDIVRDSKYDARIFELAARPIAYITDMLLITPRQAVVYAIVMDMFYDIQITSLDIGRCLDISPIKAITFNDDLDELCKRKYIIRNYDDEGTNNSYHVSREAINSLQGNHAISYAVGKISNCEEWFGALDSIIMDRCHNKIDYDTLCNRIDELINGYRDMPHIKRYLTKGEILDKDDVMLFMWICNMVVSDNFETIVPGNFKKLYDNSSTYRVQRRSLASGSNELIRNGMLRVAKGAEQRTRDTFELTPWVLNEMLKELSLDISTSTTKDIVEHSNIIPKQLYYNERENRAIAQLTSLLQPTRFAQVREELRKQGFRSGFACLFHGAPGTGKTETVLQLARNTGRNIMQVNISEIKSMWVGESEKNIKAIFSRYSKLVEESEVAPILLFNEADAIIGKRLTEIMRSTDKMENAMQNIILEEIEKLDGILIATTNLTCNMDSAFERRFLYKIEFEKPSMEAKSSIWKSMIAELTDEDAITLATKYDFSGGQIENIARKSVVDKILSGEALSIEALSRHCDSELIARSNSRKPIGY